MPELRAVLLVLLFGATVRAQEQIAPTPPDQFADKVLAAFAAKDEKTLTALAKEDEPDVWLVADELCSRGEHGAAQAFVDFVDQEDAAALVSYIASRRGDVRNTRARAALTRGARALREGRPEQALSALEGEAVEDDDLLRSRTESAKGLALRALHRYRQSTETCLAAAALARKLGWLAGESEPLAQASTSAYLGSEYSRAREIAERRLAVERKRRNDAGIADTLGTLCQYLRDLGLYADALAAGERAVKVRQTLRSSAGVARDLHNIGVVQYLRGNLARALELQEEVVRLTRASDDQKLLAETLNEIGAIRIAQGEPTQALKTLDQANELVQTTGSRRDESRILANMGIAHEKLGHYAEALALHVRALGLAREVKHRTMEGQALLNLGNVHRYLGAYKRALELQREAQEIFEGLQYRHGMAYAFANVGSILAVLGEYREALESCEQARAIAEELGELGALAQIVGNIGVIHRNFGRYPESIANLEDRLRMEREVGNRLGIAQTLGNLGAIHEDLGDYKRALAYQEEALTLQERLLDRAGMVTTLGNIGVIYRRLGNLKTALQYHERAYEAAKDLDDQAAMAQTLMGVGLVYTAARQYERALTYHMRSLELRKQAGDRVGEASSVSSIGDVLRLLGRNEEAEEYVTRALRFAKETGNRRKVASSLWTLAKIRMAEDVPAALELLKQAVDTMAPVTSGLAEEQGAKARQRWSGLFDLGVGLAITLRRHPDMCFFLENAKARILLESLGGQNTLLSTLPRSLREAASLARASENRAAEAYRRARGVGATDEIETARTQLEAAWKETRLVVERMQREAKAAAHLVFPEASSLEQIQQALRPGEALVLYHAIVDVPTALVVKPEQTVMMARGKLSAIRQAARVWQEMGRAHARGVALPAGTDSAAAMEESVQTLRALLLEPLHLDASTTRLLISPHDVMCYLPFSLLASDLEVAYVPSGTVYRILAANRKLRGREVLALGDPAYAGDVNALGPGCANLTRLPATRVEVQAIGERVLLGSEASESSFRAAISGASRWRSVHLACHGCVDPAEPLASALALIPGSGHDGRLTALEVLHMSIPSDLVVLSACETGRGKAYRAEGMVGFARAFMVAGASRVIVSLWKVDDEATRALMVKFYELWNPLDGSKGLPTATALKKAQEFVASHEKWKDPYYWAAWQLWGLAD